MLRRSRSDDPTPPWVQRIEKQFGLRKKSWWERHRFTMSLYILLGILLLEVSFILNFLYKWTMIK